MTSDHTKGIAPTAELVCLALLVLYFVTAHPTVGWRDGPEFAAATHTLGIAHPAGFPTFSLITKLAAFLPLGSIPFRINLCVAVFSAATLFLLYKLVHRLGCSAGPDMVDHRVIGWAAAGTALVMGVTSTIWINATDAEVYSLNLFFLGAVLYCAVRWSAGDGEGWLYSGAFLYGLAAGNHATVAFYLPGLLVYVFFHSRRSNLLGRLFLLSFFFLVGFSVYVYLPIRASADPAFDFGHPNTWERFLMHITDRKDAYDHFSGVRQGPQLFHHLWVFFSQTTPWPFWLLGFPVLLVGAWRLIKSDWPLVAALALISGANVVFFLRWTNPTAFLPSFFVAAVLTGVGAAWLLGRLDPFHSTKAGFWQAVMVSLFVVVFAGEVWIQYPVRNRSDMFLPLESFRDDFENLPPDALCFSSILWFHHRAFQDVYRMREDVTVLGLSDFIRPEHFNPVTPERFPRITLPPGGYEYRTWRQYLWQVITANQDQGREIYFEPNPLVMNFYPNLEPAGEILLRFASRPTETLAPEIVQATLQRLQRKLAYEVEEEDLLDVDEIDAYYFSFLFRYAEFFRMKRSPGAAVALLTFVQDFLGPKGKNTLLPDEMTSLDNEIGIGLLYLHRFEAAEYHFRQAVARDPLFYDGWANLGMLYVRVGRLEDAREALEQALGVTEAYPEALFNMGRYYKLTGRADQAQDYFRRALKVAQGQDIAGQIEKELEDLTGNKGLRQ